MKLKTLLVVGLTSVLNLSFKPTPFLVKEISVGGSHTCALSTKGQVKCWGSNYSGDLGLGDKNYRGGSPNEMGENLKPVDLGSDFVPRSISGGTCAVSTKNQVKCWGNNSSGQLGQGDRNDRGDDPNEMGENLKPIDLGSNFFVADIAVDWRHSCALSTKNQIKCWGSNDYGQLGQGDRNGRGDDPSEMGENLKPVDLGSDFIAVDISAGGDQTCALSTKNQIKCWGNNIHGHLGLGDTDSRGDEPKEMGDKLKPISLGSNFIPVSISTHSGHTCALSIKNQIKCWGVNDFGQLGLGDKDIRGDVSKEMGDKLKIVNLGTDFTPANLSGGFGHTCALSTKNQIKCWGNNENGELGLGDINPRGDDPNEMGDNLKSVDFINSIFPLKIASGGRHTCVISFNQIAYCWGGNWAGQLGRGDINPRGDDPNEMGDLMIEL